MHRSVNTVIAPATERQEAEPRVDCPVTTSVLIILTIKLLRPASKEISYL